MRLDGGSRFDSSGAEYLAAGLNVSIDGHDDLLDREFSSLKTSESVQRSSAYKGLHGRTYSEHSQQRRLSRILQPDHGHLHFLRPVRPGQQLEPGTEAANGKRLARARKLEAASPAPGAKHTCEATASFQLTKTSATTNRTSSEIAQPYLIRVRAIDRAVLAGCFGRGASTGGWQA